MKILIIKSSSLGDIIHSFEVLNYLRTIFPLGTLDWVVESSCKELIECNPLVDKAYVIESKKWRKSPKSYLSQLKELRKHMYDVAFDLQGNIKSSLILMQVRARSKVGFGRKSVAEWPNLFFTTKRYNPPKGGNIREDYLYLVKSYFKNLECVSPLSRNLNFRKAATASACTPNLSLSEKEVLELKTLPKGAVIVAPSSRWPNKEVADKRLLDLLQTLEGPFYFLWRGEQENIRVRRLAAELLEANLLPELSLPLLQHLIAQNKLVIAMDSLVLHLAGTTKTPTISFFGPSSGQKYAPLGGQHTFYQGSCPFGETFSKRCRFLRTCSAPKCMEEQ